MVTHRTAITAATSVILLSASLGAGFRVRSAQPTADDPRVVANRDLRPAGTLRGQVLSLHLEVCGAQWWPSADTGRSLPVHAFAELGRAPEIPGPLIRVPVGTEIRATIHNALSDSTLLLFGLARRLGSTDDTLEIPPGATRTVRFAADVVGTFFYWGTTTHATIDTREWLDSQLAGAFIVDPLGPTPHDRVFVLGAWQRTDSTAHPEDPTQRVLAINGKSWPHTERLTTQVGDSTRWRWVNPTGSSHPMHLHGVFFRLESRGDWRRDTIFSDSRRPLEVTELILPGGTMTMRWAAARAGNWLFHCHFAKHQSRYETVDPPAAIDTSPLAHYAEHGMGALVLGIHATAAPGSRAVVEPGGARRRLRLLVQSAARRFGTDPGLGYVLQTGSDEPARDSLQIPGPPIILTRGEPVRITVVNHLSEPTTVHWHGLEIESYPDGVPGWSGSDHIFQSIAPADSFDADFTPPRAGTFIYHTHFHETRQLGLGLYGPLIVLAPGQRFDPETDRIVVVGLNGSSESNTRDTASALINGRVVPEPIELRAGTRYRLRLINIDADQRILCAFVRDSVPLTWRPIAKDGADLPPALAVTQPARLLTGPGETADFEIAATERGDLQLRVSAPYTNRPWTIDVPVHVR